MELPVINIVSVVKEKDFCKSNSRSDRTCRKLKDKVCKTVDDFQTRLCV